MKCLRPVLIQQGSIKPMEVPCGKCMVCKEMIAKEWSTRLLHEYKSHSKACFITLTYSEESLPEDESISKEELQKFFKRLRKNSGMEIKYFACGEYGEKYGRPHYHAILFGIGLKHDDKVIIEKSWKFGSVNYGHVTIASMKYVTGYILKGGKIENSKEKPFRLMSKGLGKEFALNNKEYLMKDLSLTVNGYRQTLPRYYTKVLDIPEEIKIEKAIENEKMSVRKIISMNINTRSEYIRAESSDREQRKLNMESRKALRRRDKF